MALRSLFIISGLGQWKCSPEGDGGGVVLGAGGAFFYGVAVGSNNAIMASRNDLTAALLLGQSEESAQPVRAEPIGGLCK